MSMAVATVNKRKREICFITAWLVLNVLDVALTSLILTGGGRETNIFAAPFTRTPWALLVMKIAIPVLVVAILDRIKRLDLLQPLAGGMAVIVFWLASWLFF